jgi:hypothetical protein
MDSFLDIRLAIELIPKTYYKLLGSVFSLVLLVISLISIKRKAMTVKWISRITLLYLPSIICFLVFILIFVFNFQAIFGLDYLDRTELSIAYLQLTIILLVIGILANRRLEGYIIKKQIYGKKHKT